MGINAGQVRRANREQQLQSDVARVGALVLIPSLIAAFFGANVGLPYRDSALGLVLLFALSGAAVLVALGIVRRRYPPPQTASERRSVVWRELRRAPGGMAIIAGAALMGFAVLMIIAAVLTGEILPPSKDPVVERLDELIRAVERGR